MKTSILSIFMALFVSATFVNAQTCTNAITFTNAEGFVDLGEAQPAASQSQFALEAWIYWTGGELKIYERNVRHHFGVNRDGALTFNWGNNVTCRWQTGGITSDRGMVPANKWVHVAFRQNMGEAMDMFVNGKVVKSIPGWHNLDPKECGSRALSSSNTAGNSVTDLRLWLTFRSNEQISGNMNTCFTGKEDGLWAYYRFENETGSAVTNLTGKGNNGALSGGMSAASNRINSGAKGEGPKGCDCKASTEKITTCEGKQFKVDADKKIWEMIGGKWVHVGDRCKELICNRRRVFCVSLDGSIWRYNGTPNNWTQANTLLAGQDLNAGTVMGGAHYLASTNGKHFFYMQENGDLGVWTHDPDPVNVFTSRTSPQTNCTLMMQTDGNLVAYNAAKTPIWASDTHFSFDQKYNQEKYKPVRLVLENDGTLVLYSKTNYKVWTNTGGKLPLN